MSAIERLNEYVRTASVRISEDEQMLSDLEEVLALFSTIETEVAITDYPNRITYLAPYTAVTFSLSPDSGHKITVRAIDEGLEIMGERGLQVLPMVSNSVLVQVRP